MDVLDAASPITCLPTEILQQIFLLTLPSPALPTARESPVVLTHISSRLRHVAIGHTALWSSFHLQKTPRDEKSLACLMDTWLSRAHPRPLTIHIGLDGPFTPPVSIGRPLLEVLFRHSGRWKEVKFRNLFVAASLPEEAKRLEMPMLESCDLGSPYAQGYNIGGVLFDCLSAAPNISNLSVAGPEAAFSPSFPAHKLTSLSLESMVSLPRAVTVLQQCPKLETVTFHLRHTSDTLSQPIEKLHLPNLRSLEMHIWQDPSALYDVLDVPNLETLRLFDDRADEHFPSLFSLVHTCSRQSLTTLRLNCAPFPNISPSMYLCLIDLMKNGAGEVGVAAVPAFSKELTDQGCVRPSLKLVTIQRTLDLALRQSGGEMRTQPIVTVFEDTEYADFYVRDKFYFF